MKEACSGWKLSGVRLLPGILTARRQRNRDDLMELTTEKLLRPPCRLKAGRLFAPFSDKRKLCPVYWAGLSAYMHSII